MGGWAGGADWVLKGYRVGWVFEVPEWSPRAFLKVAHSTKAELPGDPRSLSRTQIPDWAEEV